MEDISAELCVLGLEKVRRKTVAFYSDSSAATCTVHVSVATPKMEIDGAAGENKSRQEGWTTPQLTLDSSGTFSLAAFLPFWVVWGSRICQTIHVNTASRDDLLTL